MVLNVYFILLMAITLSRKSFGSFSTNSSFAFNLVSTAASKNI